MCHKGGTVVFTRSFRQESHFQISDILITLFFLDHVIKRQQVKIHKHDIRVNVADLTKAQIAKGKMIHPYHAGHISPK